MTHQAKILVAGYSSWAKAPLNPATVVVDNLKQWDWSGLDIRFIHMPVASEPLYETIEQLMVDFQPDAWVGLGVSGKDKAIVFEKLAINWRHFLEIPDVNGERMNQLPIIPNGPVAIEANFPNEHLVSALLEIGIDAKLSFHAGTHLCNQMLYTSNYLAQKNNKNTLCGFIHIPFITPPEGNLTIRNDTHKAMAEQPLTNAIGQILKQLNQHIHENRNI